MAFLGFKKDIMHEFGITLTMQGRNFYACLWVFLIEMTLIAIIFKVVVFDKEDFSFKTSNIEVYVTRYVAGMLLHMELIEDVK